MNIPQTIFHLLKGDCKELEFEAPSFRVWVVSRDHGLGFVFLVLREVERQAYKSEGKGFGRSMWGCKVMEGFCGQ